MIGEALRAAVGGSVLDDALMAGAMEDILAGRATPAQVAGLAVALRMRGETSRELAAAARVLRRRATPVPIELGGAPLVDTCGTGGDGSHSFNVSTAAAIAAAAAGVRVAKHGNRAVSSRSGSADVLEALGIDVDVGPERAARALRELGITFFFAPRYHGALRHAADARRELGVRTFFNLLGPLANPAGATHQVLGVYAPALVPLLADVLAELGAERAWVVHGHGGLDEISVSGPTEVAVVAAGGVTRRVLRPEEFGVAPSPVGALAGGDALENAALARAVFDGAPGAARDAVVVNAAAALLVAGLEEDPRAAAARVAVSLDRGDAAALLARWARYGAEDGGA